MSAQSGSWPSLRVSFQAPGSQGEQLRRGRELPEGGTYVAVTQIRRQPRHERPDVLAGAVPPDQGVHSKAVAHVVHPGTVWCPGPDAGHLEQPAERLAEVRVEKRGAGG